MVHRFSFPVSPGKSLFLHSQCIRYAGFQKMQQFCFSVLISLQHHSTAIMQFQLSKRQEALFVATSSQIYLQLAFIMQQVCHRNLQALLKSKQSWLFQNLQTRFGWTDFGQNPSWTLKPIYISAHSLGYSLWRSPSTPCSFVSKDLDLIAQDSSNCICHSG